MWAIVKDLVNLTLWFSFPELLLETDEMQNRLLQEHQIV
jgi:hypothetical protein